jgi:feruloyl esterase
MVHGWSDGTGSALATADYFQRIVSRMGRADTTSFLRLYLAPGMQHGRGGPGPNVFRGGDAASQDRRGSGKRRRTWRVEAQPNG